MKLRREIDRTANTVTYEEFDAADPGVVLAVYDEPITPPNPRDVNAGAINTRLRQALATNATYLALGSPTAAQNLAQIRALTRECSALIRSVLAELDDITGT